ncbi:MAG: hypothetical protein MK132_20045 [Lentisphaerales bacterium]|nr:hypothetical protein [Lentisphaerales bacterium]
MARRRRRKDSGGNLDSLLDTMTSVVGILIIILIVIQIGVKEKVKELVLDNANKEISATEIQQKQDEVEALKKLIDKKEKDFLSKNQAYKKSLQETKKLEQELKVVEKRLLATKNSDVDPTKITQELSKALKEIKEAEAKLQKVDVDEKKLKSLVSAYKKKKKVKADARVKMPSPRPAPQGARGVYFICKGGRVYFRDDEVYRDYFMKKLEQARIKPNKNDEYNYAAVEKYFSTRSNITPFGKFEAFSNKTRIYFRMLLNRSVGETSNFLLSRSSKFQKNLAKLDRQKYYIVFQVSPESYPVYLKARAIAEKLGYSCGWSPMLKNVWDYNLWTRMLVEGGKKAEAEAKKNNPPKKPNNVLD